MKKAIISVITFCIMATTVSADTAGKAEEKTLFSIGSTVAKSLQVFMLSPEEFQSVLKGMKDTFEGKSAGFNTLEYSPKIQELAKSRRKAKADKESSANREYLVKAENEKGAIKKPSGLVYIPVSAGSGESPKAENSVKVHYSGKLIDGTEFDSSYKRGTPAEFKLSGVIKCWQEGVAIMKKGGKARLVCPSNLAYGENGAGDNILPGATLDFEVELLDVKK